MPVHHIKLVVDNLIRLKLLEMRKNKMDNENRTKYKIFNLNYVLLKACIYLTK